MTHGFQLKREKETLVPSKAGRDLPVRGRRISHQILSLGQDLWQTLAALGPELDLTSDSQTDRSESIRGGGNPESVSWIYRGGH